MNKLLVCTCVLLCLTAVCAAQSDTPQFKGFYVGGNIGGAMGNSDTNTSTVFSPTGYFASSSVSSIAVVGQQHPGPNGFTGGGQVGYNYQTKGGWLMGFEADFGGMGLDDKASSTTTYPCCSPTSYTLTQKVSTSWLITARPRFGYGQNNWLVYATTGVAMTNFSYTSTFTDTFANAHENGGFDENKAGWTGGGGVEFKVHKKWSVRGEYLYADFGNDKLTSTNLGAFTPSIPFPSNVFSHGATLSANIVRFGFNYIF